MLLTNINECVYLLFVSWVHLLNSNDFITIMNKDNDHDSGL